MTTIILSLKKIVLTTAKIYDGKFETQFRLKQAISI